MKAIPTEIDLDNLPGPVRGKHPALYVRDEIVWSPDSVHFSLAYTITESSYGNEVGILLWGSYEKGKLVKLGNPERSLVCCWFSPWCTWVSPTIFVFKSQLYDGSLHQSLVAIDVAGKFAVLRGTDNTESRPTLQLAPSLQWYPYSQESLYEDIQSNA